MNVDHVLDSEVPVPTAGQDKLLMIFARQRELMDKYEPIEHANGLLQTHDIPVDLHDKFGQARLKDMSWRVTEELTEAVEALLEHTEVPNHFLEEVSDALHFLVEFTTLAGINPTTLIHLSEPGDYLGEMFHRAVSSTLIPTYSGGEKTILVRRVYDVIHYLGLACNCLKNKPWKQTQQLTDRVKFVLKVQQAWASFIIMSIDAGFTPNTLFAMYFKKSEVNKFRQRSKY